MVADGVAHRDQGRTGDQSEPRNETTFHTIAEAASPMIGAAPARGEIVTFLLKKKNCIPINGNLEQLSSSKISPAVFQRFCGKLLQVNVAGKKRKRKSHNTGAPRRCVGVLEAPRALKACGRVLGPLVSLFYAQVGLQIHDFRISSVKAAHSCQEHVCEV